MRKNTLKFLTGFTAVLGLLVLLIGAWAGSPSIIQGQSNATATPLPLFALPDARLNRSYASGSIALLSDGRTLIAANMINNTATITVPGQNRLIAEIPVGNDPRSVAVTPDDSRALVTNRVDGTLSVIDVQAARVTNTIDLGGVFPYGVVTGDNRIAYVSLMGSNQIAEVDLDAGQVVRRIDVPDMPAGLALWGDFLYVSHFWSGDLSLIYLPQRRVAQTFSTGADTGLFQAIELDITRGLAYLPQTRSHADNLTLTADSAVFPVINVVDLRGGLIQRGERIALDTVHSPDITVNMPFALALDRFSQRLYVANAGSNSVSVIDVNTGTLRASIPVGSNPRGILLNRDYTVLYVHNALDATITTIDTTDYDVLGVQPISNLTISVDVLLGAQLFYGARDSRMSGLGGLSCANCHFDGLSDGRVWAGFPDGPRNTPLLYALPETIPYNWSGTWGDLRFIEYKIRDLHAGTGLIDSQNLLPLPEELVNPLLESDLDLLTAYLVSLTPPPILPTDDETIIARGLEVFTEQNCAECHVGVVGTNLQAHDVGTGLSPLERHGTSFDTPSLRWLRWSAPYFHDGSAASLYDVFALEGEHQLIFEVPPHDIDALIAYLNSLPE